MAELEDKRYSISEVSEIVDVSQHLLRQWETRFSPMLRPKRTRTGQRYYERSDIDVVRRIKTLIRDEGMTTPGARVRLLEELRGEGRPRSDREALEIVRAIETEVQAMLERLDQVLG